jgi:hypothetical protein
MSQFEHAPVQCRIANVSTDVKSSLAYLDFCAFELPRCDGCRNEGGLVSTLKPAEDPMNSMVVSGWLYGDLPCTELRRESYRRSLLLSACWPPPLHAMPHPTPRPARRLRRLTVRIAIPSIRSLGVPWLLPHRSGLFTCGTPSSRSKKRLAKELRRVIRACPSSSWIPARSAILSAS